MGSIRHTGDGRGTVRVEDIYDTDVEDLWSAITEPARVARWIATVEGDLRQGGYIFARFTSTYEGPGRIDVCDPPVRLVVTWDLGTANETVTEALLTPAGDKTRLVVEERGIPLAELAEHGAGWQAHVEDLASYLSGQEPGAWRDRWAELTPYYHQLADDV